MPGTLTHRIASALCATLMLSASLAQSSGSHDDGGYRFEVATVKPVDRNSPGVISVGTDIDPGGIVKLHALTLKAMIAEAFNLQYWQLEGAEPWMEKNQYDVEGKPPDEVSRTMPDTRHTWYTINDPRLREMLQNLLIQRFALKVHRSTKSGKVYLLERTSSSLALHPSKTASSEPSSSPRGFASIGFAGDQWTLYDTTMSQLAQFASGYILHHPVLDRTGLSGAFDYRSQPQDWDTYQADPNGSFVRLLQEVGLKLEPGNGVVETLVIDHAQPPSAN